MNTTRYFIATAFNGRPYIQRWGKPDRVEVFNLAGQLVGHASAGGGYVLANPPKTQVSIHIGPPPHHVMIPCVKVPTQGS